MRGEGFKRGMHTRAKVSLNIDSYESTDFLGMNESSNNKNDNNE